MSTLLWILVGIIYFVVMVTLGLATLRKGHLILFIFGFVFPFMWLLGAVFPATPRAAAAAREAERLAT
jgi:hypothetical protein